MPIVEDVKSSWADEVEEEGTVSLLPPPTQIFENGNKIVTEYKFDENGKKVKIVRTFKIVRRIVSKTIAKRRMWKKFGQSAKDKPGPDPATTVVGEDVLMQYLSNKEEDHKSCESVLDKLKSLANKSVFTCRTCGGDHWTAKCPYKDTELGGGVAVSRPPAEEKKEPSEDRNNPPVSKYIPPSLREGANKTGQAMTNPRLRDDAFAIRISNLSESTTEADLDDLVRPFGQTQKLYLAKDKANGRCKGFAYIHFRYKMDASKAIAQLNGFGYDHLILNVDWSKPPT